MKFGIVAVHDALGGILAHSVQVGARRLRKGLFLSQNEIDGLLGAGLKEVTVARLECGDLDENEAAMVLAEALVPDPKKSHLELTAPFTGRVNLVANRPGVAVMDVDALIALNAVNAMITLATVPPFQQVGAGQMVGTVKIISYGVTRTDVVAAAKASEAAIWLAPVVLRTASLIITDIPGGPGDKGQRAVAARVEALGMLLVETQIVAHQTDALARAIAKSTGELVLILTGSATSDLYDVAPEALRCAGGHVERFGMPVDPGNLLFLGHLSGKPVIGLPGCAKSPALNGADWILARIACGIDVSHEDIAKMGVGGLLKEIPTRPMPRERRR